MDKLFFGAAMAVVLLTASIWLVSLSVVCRRPKPLKSIALTADSAVMTCIVNDYGYEHIYSRQVEGLGVEGDVLVGITTSGNSENVLNAFNVQMKGIEDHRPSRKRRGSGSKLSSAIDYHSI